MTKIAILIHNVAHEGSAVLAAGSKAAVIAKMREKMGKQNAAAMILKEEDIARMMSVAWERYGEELKDVRQGLYHSDEKPPQPEELDVEKRWEDEKWITEGVTDYYEARNSTPQKRLVWTRGESTWSIQYTEYLV
tara:strand:+ start:293 stop:697 length:405 start_codon:yes stop_codon:yes gene_type:complete